MALSRLRLRIATGFALAFAVSLAILAIGALGYLWRESNRRFDARLDAVATGAIAALTRELAETPDSSLAYAANEVVLEWPRNGDAFAIVDERGTPVAVAEHDSASARVLAAWPHSAKSHFAIERDGADQRVSALRTTITVDSAHAWKVGVAAFGSTEGIESDAELLGITLAIAAPLIVLVSLVAGYYVAQRALRPVTTLGSAIAAIAPTDLTQRLPETAPRDEVGMLAHEFNALLARLHEAQQRNRGFILEAAHQIRTPLTLVLGEAGHELSSSEPDAPRMRATLARIRTAAEQMRRRVDELFLLAEAQSGEPVQLDNDVELDGLVLECTDLMRSRAQALGRSLAIGSAEHVTVRGNAALLQEALLELIENACKHGNDAASVTVSSAQNGTHALLEVTSAGAPFDLPVPTDSRSPEGLGLPIVQWVARTHGGSVRVHHDGALNTVQLTIAR